MIANAAGPEDGPTIGVRLTGPVDAVTAEWLRGVLGEVVGARTVEGTGV